MLLVTSIAKCFKNIFIIPYKYAFKEYFSLLEDKTNSKHFIKHKLIKKSDVWWAVSEWVIVAAALWQATLLITSATSWSWSSIRGHLESLCSHIPRGGLQKDLGESNFRGSHHPPPLVSAEKFVSETSSLLLLRKYMTDVSCVTCISIQCPVKWPQVKLGEEGGVFSFRGGFTLTFLLVLLNWCNSLCYWRDKRVPSLSSQINFLNPRNYYWKAAKTGMHQATIVRTFLPSKEVNSKMVRSTRLLTEINRLVWGAGGDREHTAHETVLCFSKNRRDKFTNKTIKDFKYKYPFNSFFKTRINLILL